MRLKSNIKTKMLLKTAVLYDDATKVKRIYKMNRTAHTMTDLLREKDMSEDEIVEAFVQMYGIDIELAKKDVHATVEFLNSINALEQ